LLFGGIGGRGDERWQSFRKNSHVKPEARSITYETGHFRVLDE
jgi:hypothetical protein